MTDWQLLPEFTDNNERIGDSFPCSMIMDQPEVAQTSEYWTDARAPLSSLLFLLPWMIVYEAGVLSIGAGDADTYRNGADYWMRLLLGRVGAAQVLLPLLVLAVLLLWHLIGRFPWRVSFSTLGGMLAESVLLAIVLLSAGRLHDFAFHWSHSGGAMSGPVLNGISPTYVQAVSFVGAGVYEEVMFRLCLIPAAWLIFRMFEFPSLAAALMAAICTSFLFALAHHVGPAADAFNLFVFSFRTLAGLFFSAVFLLRGFGITVGCHAAYDLMVGMLLAVIPGAEAGV